MTHGGDIYRNKVHLDYSVNLNPEPVPESVICALSRGIREAGAYPDPDEERVRGAVARADGVDAANVFAGNGASEILLAIVRAFSPASALLIEPCYSGYRYALDSLGSCRIREACLREEDGFAVTEEILPAIDGGADILFLTDPWNPTGRNIAPRLLEEILERAEQNAAAVVLDQSFYMLSDAPAAQSEPGLESIGVSAEHRTGKDSLRSLIKTYKNLIVVRSYTKLFSLPGIRMGYVVSSADNVKKIRRQLPEWNLSSTAGCAMEACAEILSGGARKICDYTMIARERAYLSAELTKMGCKVYGSDTIYILFRSDQPVYDKLLDRGILIRDCSNYRGLGRGYYRIAVRSPKENKTLIKNMREALRVEKESKE